MMKFLAFFAKQKLRVFAPVVLLFLFTMVISASAYNNPTLCNGDRDFHIGCGSRD